ncbi:MAG: ribosome silencing factor [Elusimicrobiales bacterium]|nr:ribosome silencing factor [Elusimicrobiales bacterium]
MKDKKYYKKIAVEIAKLIDAKKGENTILLDVESKTGLFYYALVTTILSNPHLNAIEEEIIKRMKQNFNEYTLHRDGVTSQQWKVLDYGGLVIHIMDEKSREFYAIDKIYSDCKKVRWEKKERKNKSTKPSILKNKNKK